jgi:hypothetical protein
VSDAPEGGGRASRWGRVAGVGVDNVPIYELPPKTDVHGLGFDPYKVIIIVMRIVVCCGVVCCAVLCSCVYMLRGVPVGCRKVLCCIVLSCCYVFLWVAWCFDGYAVLALCCALV